MPSNPPAIKGRPARPTGHPPASPPLSRKGRTRRGNWRKACFALHGWLGLNLGLFLFVVCLSGSFATLSYEIDWLIDARHRVPAQRAPYDWTAMHERIATAFPDGQNLGVYAPLWEGGAAMAYVTVPTGQTRKVLLNPYTGALLGHTSFFNVQRFFRSFHRRFFDGTRGITLVTLWGVVLLVVTLTGFLFYKGWLKQLMTLRRTRGRRLLWSDLHKTAGIWGLVFSLLIALTGLFYLVEVLYQGAGAYDALLPPPLPQVDEAGLAAFGPQPALLPVEVYVRAAEAAYPELDVRSVRIPHRPEQAVYVDGQAGNALTRDRADKVHLHPFTAEVLGIQTTGDLGPVPFITDAVDPLHFGYFGGLWTKVLWFVLGLLLSFSMLSGTYLWVVRTETARVGKRSLWLRGAPVSVALTLAYFVVVAFATVRGIQVYAPTNEPPVPIGRAEAGPYEVRLDCAAPCDPDAGATYTVRFTGDGLPNYAGASLAASGGEPVLLEGPNWMPAAEIQGNGPLTLRITLRDGVVYEASFSTSALPAPAPAAGAAWPDTAPGVWWVVGGFVVLVVGSVAGWLFLVVRVLQKTSRAQAERPPSGIIRATSMPG